VPPLSATPDHMRPERSFQGLILTLQSFWAEQGCVVLQPYDMEMGAGTFHPATTLRSKLGRVTEPELGPEDLKIITLARSARARVGSAEGAAVRDETGRTYAAAAVALPSLRVSALSLAVAMAVSSGAVALEAAALVSDGPGPAPEDVGAVTDIGSGALIIHAGSDGAVREIVRL